MNYTPKIAVLASGSGTNFEAIAKACQSGVLPASIAILIVNRDCGACERATRLAVPHRVIKPRDFDSESSWDQEVCKTLAEQGVDWVVLAGFLKKVGEQTLSQFSGKILNIHPALLPKFGGPGMYGNRVHQAVFDAKENITGSTIHYVTENYDEGPIIAQHKIELSQADTPESISERVRSIENAFYVKTLKTLLTS